MFFAPVRKEEYGKFLEFQRLYSYPKQPEPHCGKRCIIDSGAHGFMMQGKEYDKYEVELLAKHHDALKDYILVAPDVSANPAKSMQMFEYYKSISDNEICPVFQFSNETFNFKEFILQYEFYAQHIKKKIFVTDKNAMNSARLLSGKMLDVLKLIRKYVGNEVSIHFFSCGKSLFDIRYLSQIENITFDTTNYQFDARTPAGCSKWGVKFTRVYELNMKAILDKIYNTIKLYSNNAF